MGPDDGSAGGLSADKGCVKAFQSFGVDPEVTHAHAGSGIQCDGGGLPLRFQVYARLWEIHIKRLAAVMVVGGKPRIACPTLQSEG